MVRPRTDNAAASSQPEGVFTKEKQSMKIKAATMLVACGLLLNPVLGFTADDMGHSKPATFVKDSVITTKIKAKLAAEHLASLSQVKVDTDDAGVVWLTGTAPSQADADKVVAIARGTEGVSTVKSEIVIKP
jgi:hyperosmotically inducible protein